MVEATKKPDQPATDPNAPVTYKLSRPVQSEGETIKQLTFRQPTGGDLMLLGDQYPISFDAEGGIRINPGAMGEIMWRLANVPAPTVRSLSAKDFSGLCWALAPLFLPDVPERVL